MYIGLYIFVLQLYFVHILPKEGWIGAPQAENWLEISFYCSFYSLLILSFCPQAVWKHSVGQDTLLYWVCSWQNQTVKKYLKRQDGWERDSETDDDKNVMEGKTAGGKKMKWNAKYFALSLWIWKKHILPEEERAGNEDGEVRQEVTFTGKRWGWRWEQSTKTEKKVNASIEFQLIGPVKMSKCEKI